MTKGLAKATYEIHQTPEYAAGNHGILIQNASLGTVAACFAFWYDFDDAWLADYEGLTEQQQGFADFINEISALEPGQEIRHDDGIEVSRVT